MWPNCKVSTMMGGSSVENGTVKSKTAVPVSGWGTGKGDAETKKYIGETEKNLQALDIKGQNDKSMVINHEEQYTIKKAP